MTAYYVIIESVTTLWLWVGWLWKCNIPMTQSVRRLSIIRSVCHNFLKGVICKIMHIIYKIVKMAPRHCSVVGCKSSQQPVDHGGDTLDISANTESLSLSLSLSLTLSIYLPSLTVCPFNFVFFITLFLKNFRKLWAVMLP